MSFEDNRAADLQMSEILPLVQKILPDSNQPQVSYIYHGTYNVYDINSEYILRVPDRTLRNSTGIAQMKYEHAILNWLSPNLNYDYRIKIPQIKHILTELPYPCLIYSKIPGVSLNQIWPIASATNRFRIIQQIASFLTHLHTLNYETSENPSPFDSNFSTSDYKQYWENRYEECKNVVFPQLSIENREWIRKVFEKFLKDHTNFDFIPCICHCDFDMSNIVVNPEQGYVTGIIDFEETKLWDPAADFVFAVDKPPLLQELLELYPRSLSESFQNRLKFLFCRTAVAYLLYGFQHQLQDLVEEGFRKLIFNQNLFPYP